MSVCSNVFNNLTVETTPTNKGRQRKHPKTANGIFQVEQVSFSETESAFPYIQVPMATNSPYVKKSGG